MYAELTIPAALRGFVAALWTYTGNGSPHRVLPDGCLDFIFDPSSGSASVVGPMTRSVVVPGPRGRTSFGVRFRPGHAARFIDASASELRDDQGSLRELTRVAQLSDRIANAPNHVERVRLVTLALLDANARVRAPDTRVDRAVRLLTSSCGNISIPELARQVDLGERQLERRFLEHVGLAPKRLARIVRFEHALALAERRAFSQARLAVHAGYNDEPHLLRDFRALSGLTPSGLMRERDVGFVQGAASTAG